MVFLGLNFLVLLLVIDLECFFFLRFLVFVLGFKILGFFRNSILGFGFGGFSEVLWINNIRIDSVVLWLVFYLVDLNSFVIDMVYGRLVDI